MGVTVMIIGCDDDNDDNDDNIVRDPMSTDDLIKKTKEQSA